MAPRKSKVPHSSVSATMPVVISRNGKGTMDFYSALRAVLDGNQITRLSFDNVHEYAVMQEGFLYWRAESDGLLHPWHIAEADMDATDWIINVYP